MKKTAISILLVVCLLFGLGTMAGAYTQKQYRIAEALNELGLFLGDGTGYSLDNLLKRDDGTTLLVRMLGKEQDAQEGGDFGMPFTDVPFWAKGYVGYAWKNSITNGISVTEFGADRNMTDYMFLTLVLRALGYSDKGEQPLYVWNDPYEYAVELGLLTDEEPDDDFTRGEAIEIFWRALDVKCYGEDITLAERLIEQRVFTEAELANARLISQFGRVEVEEPEVPDDEEETPETTDPDPTPSAPPEESEQPEDSGSDDSTEPIPDEDEGLSDPL